MQALRPKRIRFTDDRSRWALLVLLLEFASLFGKQLLHSPQISRCVVLLLQSQRTLVVERFGVQLLRMRDDPLATMLQRLAVPAASKRCRHHVVFANRNTFPRPTKDGQADREQEHEVQKLPQAELRAK